MTCAVHLNNGTLICTRTDADTVGHTFATTSVPDAHDDTEAPAEADRG